MLIAIIVIGIFNRAIAQEYSTRHFNAENGLGGSYVYATLEDPQGYKWIGTDYGLFRFDGVGFEIIDRNDSTRTNFPTALVKTNTGRVVVGCNNGAIKEFNGVELITVFAPVENSSPIKSMVVDSNSVLWALTQNDGIIKRKGAKIVPFKLKSLVNKKANVIAFHEGLLFVGTNEGVSIFELNSDQILEYKGEVDGLNDVSVQVLVKKFNGKGYWVGTDDDGIYSMHLADKNTSDKKTVAVQEDFLQYKSVTGIREAKNNDLWITSKHSGLIKVNFNRNNTKSGQFTYLNSTNGFPSDQLSSLEFDKDQNLWIGTVGDGLIQVSKKGLLFYNFERFRVKSVNSISGTSRHEFFFGTNVGMIKGFFKGEADSLNFKLINNKFLRRKEVTAIYTDPNDKVYFALKNLGLFLSDSDFEHVTKIEFEHDASKLKIRQIVQDNQGFLWLSVLQNGVFVIDTLGNVEKHLSTTSGFYHNEIYHIHIDSKGNKWFAAHGAGLAIMKPNGEIDYLTKDGVFPARDINDISEDEVGNVWISTYGNGVYEYDGQVFSRFSTNDGLLSNYNNSVMSDKNNHIWVSHRVGLSRIDEHTNAISTIEEKDGLPTAEFIHNSVYRDHDHNIWFGNRNAVTFLNTPDQMFESKILKTIVTDVKIDHKTVDLHQFSLEGNISSKIPSDMVFPYNMNNLTFSYIAINLKNPKSNLYQFRLDGYEKDWSPATKATSINYTNLNPGKYSLMIRQSDNPNHWGDNISTLNFEIVPSWWNTWWARIITILVVFLILYGIIQFRTARLNKRLEKKKRYLEITESQNTRLKNFAFITSHNTRSYVVNLIGLMGIVESDPSNKSYFRLMRQTVEKLDITIKHIGELLNFEKKAAELDRVDCNILEVLDRVIASNSSLIKEEGIDILIDVAENIVVKAIPEYLDSIYDNLISNAVRYGTTENSKKISISAYVIEHETVVQVQDWGLGIDMKEHGNKVFELGSRFHSNKSDGQGFGLFMSKHQIEAMGGSIDIESEENWGTIVKVSFDNNN